MQGHQGCQRDQQHYGWQYQQGQWQHWQQNIFKKVSNKWNNS